MLGWRLGRGAAAVVRMASSSSSLPSLPRLSIPAHRAHHEAAMAASLGASRTLRNGGGRQMQDLVMQRWAEVVLCCGADWGCVPQLWNRVVLRKWLNIGAGSGDSDFSADERSDGEADREGANDVPHRLRRHRSEILRAQYVDVRELRICVGTWNVGGRFPPSDLDIEEWLDMEDPADIYVIGFQEIVPLNAGNIFGAEDNRPVSVWEQIIRETLNKNFSDKSRFKCHSDPPSVSRFNPSDAALSMEHESLSGSDNDSDGELQPLIEQDHNCRLQDKTDENFEAFPEEGLDQRVKRKRPEFVRMISKQMVGIFLSIWVRRSLRKHIQNLRVSTVGVGAMGYIGNKGSISVSMFIHQTPFCFVCCHLAAGEKDGDDLKRNSNIEEILRRTVFNPVHTVGMPMRIHDHERIIWLGDLNYRIDLSYERAHELISKQDWDGLFKRDQLKRELRKGCTFDGWFEGVISFPPTYKYEFDSGSYVNDESKSGRRTPAWCDRILSYGKGIRLLSYKRGELTLSDHRPVTAVYLAEVEVFRRRKLRRALTFTDAEVEHYLLSEDNGFFEPKIR
ncbi:type I inositol polyphosphate 5-phosphatase 1-like isoform X2 [Panicum virgatum]|uniref:type I inositol polyphosphate 5-phosphatase 1-like isoform X2 n=1 Tax=Panicum virgatum TaxID=38727 RepID=UPI0019D5D5B5|nr:type I inositol polyphosphate 5-phosphatase 1-like isoform X2 [Panicum virgatum]